VRKEMFVLIGALGKQSVETELSGAYFADGGDSQTRYGLQNSCVTSSAGSHWL